MGKKSIILILFIVLLAALTGCSGGETNSPAQSDRVTVDQATGLATYTSDVLSVSFPTEHWAVADMDGQNGYSGVSLQSQSMENTYLIVALMQDEEVKTAQDALAQAEERMGEVGGVAVDGKTVDGVELFGYEYMGKVFNQTYTWQVYLGYADGSLLEIDIQDGTGSRQALESDEVAQVIESLDFS